MTLEFGGNMLNKVLYCDNKEEFAEAFALMRRYSYALMRRKPERSLIQSAAMLQHVLEYGSPNYDILAIGSYEDIVFETLAKMGWSVLGTDPFNNVGRSVVGLGDDVDGTLESYATKHPEAQFRLVFANSVIEHVADDLAFFTCLVDLVAPGGVGLLTCDFKEGWVHGDRIPSHSFRFYTPEHLEQLRKIAETKNCVLIGDPKWSGTPDFEWEGAHYNFAGLAFRKEE
jgi:SAM-dependent methyltransferase